MKHRGNPLPAFVKAFDGYILYLDEWHTPATIYPAATKGSYRIHHGKYKPGMYKYWGMDGYLVFNVNSRGIPITSLQQRRDRKWHGWMVDDPPNHRAMEIYAEHAKGKVLVAGLGLGLYLHELAKNNKITEVAVVEVSSEVIQLVEPYLPVLPGFTIILDDFYEFIDRDCEQWDTILIDLWVSRSKEDKMRILYHKILPLIPVLAQKYPKANITFHGFQTVSDIKPVSERMVDLIISLGGI